MANEKSTGSGLTRRTFAVGAVGAVAVIGLGGAVRLAGGEELVRPPGGQDEDAFIGKCLRCEKCREACPENFIVPAPLEKGIINVRTPTVNFSMGMGYCDWCTSANNGNPKCIATCPTGALALPADAQPPVPGDAQNPGEPGNVVIGKALVVRNLCIAWEGRTKCSRCLAACPYGAIEQDSFGRPLIKMDVCNGCGACEWACISLKATSIQTGATVRAVTIHPTAVVEARLKEEGREG